jgi:thiosulfate dehydrogenase (quinone) large subunit
MRHHHHMNTDGADARRMSLALAALRIFVGIVWLANLSWKLPPSFGRDEPRGLLYSFHQAERWAVIGPLRDLVHDVVIPHFTLFGWLVFGVELTAGVLLVCGVLTRLGALIGTGQAGMITLLVVNAPNEWFWGYAMFIVLNAVPLLAPTDRRLTIAHLRGRT